MIQPLFTTVTKLVTLTAISIMVALHLPKQLAMQTLFQQIYAETNAASRAWIHSNVLQGGDVQFDNAQFDVQIAPNSVGHVSALAILSFLGKQHRPVLALFDTKPDACMQRDVCRLLYIKSSYASGAYERVRQLPRDKFLWQTLGGHMPLNRIPATRYDDYLANYKFLNELYPERAESYYKLGQVERAMGNWVAAFEAFQKAANFDRRDVWFACATAESAIRIEQLTDEILAACDVAEEFPPISIWAYEFVGRVHEQVGNCTKAKQMYETAQRAFSNRVEPQEWLSRLRQAEHPCGVTS